jgi:uncharacterized protein YbjT (DUF2867 family)
VQPISQQDVAAFAVEAFARPNLAGSTFRLCGPEALDGEGIAARFAEALGRPIRFRVMSPDEFGAVLDGAFGPGAGAPAVAFYRAAFENPSLITTSIDHAALLGHLPITPTSLVAWARSHAGMLTARSAAPPREGNRTP